MFKAKHTTLVCNECKDEVEEHLAIKICYSDEFFVFDTNDCLLTNISKNRPFQDKEKEIET